MAQDNSGPVAAGDVDAAAGADRRRKDEIVDALSRSASREVCRSWIKAGKNVLVVPQEIERVVIKQWRGT